MRNNPVAAALIAVLFLMLSLAGCGGSGGSSTADGTGRATLHITWPDESRLIPVAAKSITVSFLNGNTVIATQTVARPTVGNESTVAFDDLPAIALTLRAEAFPTTSGSGVPQASASKPVTVVRNESIEVTITMDSTITSFTLTPASPIIAVGGTVQLNAGALDRLGRTVLVTAATRTFTSSKPSVATVDQSGLVTGVAEGTATITVKDSESGVSNFVVVSVSNSGAASILQMSLTYLNLLSVDQRSSTVVANTAANAAKWSYLDAAPIGAGTNSLRNGIAFSVLNAEQKTAWTNLVQGALGEKGYAQFVRNRAADQFLSSQQGGFSEDYFYLGFVGEPSGTSGWLMQINGYNYAANLYFDGGDLVSTTPYFLGIEPTTFTLGGTNYTPMQDKRDAMFNLLAGLTTAQQTTANLGTTFTDVLLGPGKDARSNFPTGTTGRGILASTLTSSQQALIRTAIAAWVQDSGTDLAEQYQALYDSEIDQTYVGYSGDVSLDAQNDYVRIDGPHVWIELLIRNGAVSSAQLQYKSVWRDRVNDYNNAYGF